MPLQRLAEQLGKDGGLLCESCGMEFEPKWFPVIFTLSHRPSLSVIELVVEISCASLYTTSLLKELEAEKPIRSRNDETDERKRLLELSPKGTNHIVKKGVWNNTVQAFSARALTLAPLYAQFRERPGKLFVHHIIGAIPG